MTEQQKKDIQTAIIISGLLAHESLSTEGAIERAMNIMKALEDYEDRNHE